MRRDRENRARCSRGYLARQGTSKKTLVEALPAHSDGNSSKCCIRFPQWVGRRGERVPDTELDLIF